MMHIQCYPAVLFSIFTVLIKYQIECQVAIVLEYLDYLECNQAICHTLVIMHDEYYPAVLYNMLFIILTVHIKCSGFSGLDADETFSKI